MNAVVDVVWLSTKEGTPGRGYWDQTLLERMFVNANHHESVEDLIGAIVVVPGAYQDVTKVNAELAKLEWCVVILTSDEENKFEANKLEHDNMVVFSNYPNPKYDGISRWIPIGPARESKGWASDKKVTWGFSGQITHPGREAYAEILRRRSDGHLNETAGFGQGLEHEDYHAFLASVKVVPAPSGPFSPDSFRLYEAIEQGAVPIPHDPEFWLMLFNNPPFPILEEYQQLDGYIDDTAAQYPVLNNRVQAWWLQEQYRIEESIIEAIKKVTGFRPLELPIITVMIPVSPIKSHPDISILKETYESIRTHLPTARIIITFDGVRKEQENRRDDYEEFIRRVLWKCYNEWTNVLPIIFEKHTHQVGMAREALKYIKTSLLMYVEQDTPLTPDLPIHWGSVQKMVYSGKADVVRFHFESVIPKEHRHMMLGQVVDHYQEEEISYMKTCQWSQRPHIASVAYYRRILNDYFSEDAKSFIEDKMHGVAHEAYVRDGEMGWLQHKIVIYHPNDGNIKRSYHTDGRAGENKYDKTQVF